jgi:hypothetical protein
MADKHNFTIDKGATFERVLLYTDVNDLAIDLTGFTARMQIRPYYGKTVTYELTTENGAITIDALLGKITLLITAAITDDFNVGNEIYDLELVNGATVLRLIEGDTIITNNVTV